jgi:hypothetical protein
MMLGLLWIFGCYGSAVILLHMYYRWSRRTSRKSSHVVLITRNNQTQIEWYIRSLYFFSRFKGRDIATTIMDEGSTDETVAILERLSHVHPMRIEMVPSFRTMDDVLKEHEQEELIVVRLSNLEELVEIPLAH